MEAPSISRRRELVSLGILVLLLFAAWTAGGGLARGTAPPALFSSDPVRVDPAPGQKGRALNLPRGDVLLFAFLQELADHTGNVMYMAGELPPDRKVHLDRAYRTLTMEDAASLLDAQDLELSKVTYKGQQVLWVREPLRRERKQGKIVRRGGGGPDSGEETGAAGSPGRGDPVPASTVPELRLFRRADGEATSYLVLFETSSSREAREVFRIVQATLEATR